MQKYSILHATWQMITIDPIQVKGPSSQQQSASVAGKENGSFHRGFSAEAFSWDRVLLVHSPLYLWVIGMGLIRGR